MTNGWIDIKNTDMMLIMGGNPAENHPCGFKWPIEAKLQRNAKMIVVDPRFTRTAATADLFLQIRAGTDIAFLGGLINYAIENNRIAHDYLVNYTNAAFIVKEGFKLPEDGLYSGFDAADADLRQVDLELRGRLAASARHLLQRPRIRATRNAEAGGTAHQAARPAGANTPPPMLPPNVAYDLVAAASALRLPAAEEAVLALHAGDGRAHHRHSEGSVPEGRRPLHLHPQGRRHEEGRARSSTRSAGRSTPSARRSSAPRRCCSCCSATSAAPAAASTRCAATRTSRARPTWPASSTSCPAI